MRFNASIWRSEASLLFTGTNRRLRPKNVSETA